MELLVNAGDASGVSCTQTDPPLEVIDPVNRTFTCPETTGRPFVRLQQTMDLGNTLSLAEVTLYSKTGERFCVRARQSYVNIDVLIRRNTLPQGQESGFSTPISYACFNNHVIDLKPAIKLSIGHSVLDLKVIDADTDADTDTESSQMEV